MKNRVTEAQIVAFEEAMKNYDLTKILALANDVASNAACDAIFLHENPPVVEKTRTYVYANGDIAIYREITQAVSTLSGNHTLTMRGDLKAIVAPGWRAIEIEQEPKVNND